MNSFKRASKASAREVADVRAIEVDEAASAQFEQQESRDEIAAEADAKAFEGGLMAEDKLIRRLGALQREKFTVLRVLSATKTTRIRLSMAKKTLLGKLAIGGKRIRTGLMQFRYGGAAVIDPRFGANLQLWMQEQGKEIGMLENDLAAQMQELGREASSVAPTIQLIKQQRDVLKEYGTILADEDRKLLDIANRKMDEVTEARRELQKERDALQRERDALAQQRGAPARR